MFKSLLRTIPTLSGNVKLNCYLTDFNKKDNDIFESFVRVADLSPLQNFLYNRNIKVSLLSGSYEYDLSKYYHYYSNSFYSDNYSFNKNDYQSINISEDYIDSRNKDYEFGCKRLSFSSTGYQFNFFAPIYCDDINDLPDYFNIEIKVKNIVRNIKIYIGKETSNNHLSNYLRKYINKLRQNVIKLNHNTKSAVYYGVDILNGGIVSNNDFIISKIFSQQMTLNDYDTIINDGFKRNNMVLGQIIPLSFSFNLKDIFTKSELQYFSFNTISINGSYKKDNINYDFFDFDIDYYNYNIRKLVYDYNTDKYKYLTSNKNLLDVEYPGLKEKRYVKYKYSNKLSPTYNRWALQLNNNYIVNSNYIYNSIFDINNLYGEFPYENNYNVPYCKIMDTNELWLPYGNYLYNKDLDGYYLKKDEKTNKLIPTSNLENFIYHMNMYTTNWFSIYNEYGYTNIDDLFTNNYFEDAKNNKIMYKGIIYNFSNICNKANISSIDKFGIFINPKSKDIDNDKDYIFVKYLINNQIQNTKNIVYINKDLDGYKNIFISPTENNYSENNEYNLSYQEKNMEIDSLLYKDDKYGNYIEYDYYNNNQYYSKIDLINNIDRILNGIFIGYNIDQRIIEYTKEDLINIIKTNLINGDVLLPFDKNINGYYISNSNNDRKLRKCLWCEDFLLGDYMNYQNYNDLYLFMSNNIKYSDNNGNKKLLSKENVKNIINNLNDININFDYKFFIVKDLVSLSSILTFFSKTTIIDKNNIKVDTSSFDAFNKIKSALNSAKIDKYMYHPFYKDDKEVINDYFTKYGERYDVIYNEETQFENNIISCYTNSDNCNNYNIFVDPYNIDKLIESINKLFKRKNSDKYLSLFYKSIKFYNGEIDRYYMRRNFYSKFLNKEHLLNYYKHNSSPDFFIKHRLFELVKPDSNNEQGIFDIKFFDRYGKLNYGRSNETGNKIFKINIGKNEVQEIDEIKFLNGLKDVYNKPGFFTYEDENVSKIEFELYINEYFYTLPYEIYNEIVNSEENFGIYIYKLNNEENSYDNPILYDYENFEECVGSTINSLRNSLTLTNYEHIFGYRENKTPNDYGCSSLVPIFTDLYNSNDNSKYIKHLFNNKTIRKYNFKRYNSEKIIYNEYYYPMVVELSLSPLVHSRINEFILNKENRNLISEYIKDIDINNIDNLSFKEILTDIVLNPKNDNHYEIKKIILNGIQLYSNVNLNEINFVDKSNYNNINYIKEDKLNIYTDKNGINYCFYFINVSISPIIKNFNVDKIISNNLTISKINGNDFSKEIEKKFKYIYPYIRNINLLDTFTANNKLIKKHNKVHINLNFVPVKIQKNIDYKGIFYGLNEQDKSVYDLQLIENKKNYYNIFRYYDDIIPSFINISSNNIINNRFELKYKENKVKEFSENNIVNNNLDIYNYRGISVIDTYNNENIVFEMEYKHFNDNHFYILPEEINFNIGNNLSYKKVVELEKIENVKLEFKKYLLKILKINDIEDSELLFLFNRYNINLLSNSTRLNSFKTEKLYELKYKFTLK